MAKVLLVDDDHTFLDALKMNLEADGHHIVSAENGLRALEVLKSNKIDLVISDIRMPEMDGVAFTKAVRAQSSIPIILMTGFSEIMETQAAYAIGANEFLAKPFRIEDLTPAIERCLDMQAQKALEEEKFCKLGINDFISGRTIQFNVFIKLAPNKFIKLAHRGEDISSDRIKFYRDKGLHHLYLRREDFKQYVGFGLKLAQTATRTNILNPERKLGLLRHTGELLNEQIRKDGIDPQAYDSAETFIGATLDLLTDDVKALEVLEALRAHGDYILVHSIGVSLYSVMIAQRVGWTTPTNQFKVAMAGLLHDLGIKELSRDLISRPRYTWNHEEIKAYESHPLRGLAIVNSLDDVPEDVREVVKQHHENCAAMGFPMGTKKTAIHPMAKLVSVADEFCYRIIKSPLAKQMTPAEALNDMASVCAGQLEKNFFEALAGLFNHQLPQSSTRVS